MNWKEKLRKLEKAKRWDEAIEFLQKVIRENPNSMDAYIFMNYLLANLITEEYYDKSKEENYLTLLKWYFDESYAKFSDNPQYLYLGGKTGVIADWLLNINPKDPKYCENMIAKAYHLEPDNPLYMEENYYGELEKKDPYNPKLIDYYTMLLTPNNPVEQQLKDKGAVGEYLLEIKRFGVKEVLAKAAKEKENAQQASDNPLPKNNSPT